MADSQPSQPHLEPLWRVVVVSRWGEFTEQLSRSLPRERFRLYGCQNPEQGISLVHEQDPHLLLVSCEDCATDQQVLAHLLSSLRKPIPVVLIVNRRDEARPFEPLVDPTKLSVLVGAQSPGNLGHLMEKILESERLGKEVDYLRHREPHIYDFKGMVLHSPKMRSVMSLVQRIASSEATVLIQGETGTGKELVAAAIHFNGPRRAMPFLAVNCASLHEELLESELFGHERGAFTGADRQRVGRFEQAHGGTLFLDEVGDMSPRLQAKVLRVLQERSFERLGGNSTIQVDVRIVAATNKDLRKALAQNTFRKDLYYRLSVVPIHLPPLRDRTEDILPLARFFLHKYGHLLRGSPQGFHPKAEQAMLRYPWPGNVRELENVVERAVVVARGPLIEVGDLMLPEPVSGTAGRIQLPPEGVRLEEVEKSLIIQALERSQGVQRKAARLLGISPRALHYKLRKHGIRPPRHPADPEGDLLRPE
jgi:DNA-binding NtrC family response regulator